MEKNLIIAASLKEKILYEKDRPQSGPLASFLLF